MPQKKSHPPAVDELKAQLWPQLTDRQQAWVADALISVGSLSAEHQARMQSLYLRSCLKNPKAVGVTDYRACSCDDGWQMRRDGTVDRCRTCDKGKQPCS